MKVYKQVDLERINSLANVAIIAMHRFIEEHKLRDGGSCVMGEGIEIMYVAPGKRKPRPLMIVSQPFQGNNYEALMRAKQSLEANGVDCQYNCGRMD
jgi:hypothetical protein